MWRIDFESVSVAFTDRRGGVSQPPFDSLNLGPYTRDEPDNVARNIEIVRGKLGLSDLVWARQVHGTKVLDADGSWQPQMNDGDGLYTTTLGQGVMVSVADCVPVALAGRARAMMLHCGWRGLAGGIVESAVALFGDERPEAALGPCIGGRVYEVGNEVVEAIGPAAADHYVDGVLDLHGVARTKLRAAGVDRVESVDVCTQLNPELLFSHRRDGETGRQAGIAWLR
jgi:YfiH family protein